VQYDGATTWLPIIPLDLIRPDGHPFQIALVFDTGSVWTILDKDFQDLLGVVWDKGRKIDMDTLGGRSPGFVHKARVRLFGRPITTAEIVLKEIPKSHYWQGVLGRHPLFEDFAFGFWERAQTIYVSTNP
jgi:hypothetical protein